MQAFNIQQHWKPRPVFMINAVEGKDITKNVCEVHNDLEKDHKIFRQHKTN